MSSPESSSSDDDSGSSSDSSSTSSSNGSRCSSDSDSSNPSRIGSLALKSSVPSKRDVLAPRSKSSNNDKQLCIVTSNNTNKNFLPQNGKKKILTKNKVMETNNLPNVTTRQPNIPIKLRITRDVSGTYSIAKEAPVIDPHKVLVVLVCRLSEEVIQAHLKKSIGTNEDLITELKSTVSDCNLICENTQNFSSKTDSSTNENIRKQRKASAKKTESKHDKSGKQDHKSTRKEAQLSNSCAQKKANKHKFVKSQSSKKNTKNSKELREDLDETDEHNQFNGKEPIDVASKDIKSILGAERLEQDVSSLKSRLCELQSLPIPVTNDLLDSSKTSNCSRQPDSNTKSVKKSSEDTVKKPHPKIPPENEFGSKFTNNNSLPYITQSNEYEINKQLIINQNDHVPVKLTVDKKLTISKKGETELHIKETDGSICNSTVDDKTKFMKTNVHKSDCPSSRLLEFDNHCSSKLDNSGDVPSKLTVGKKLTTSEKEGTEHHAKESDSSVCRKSAVKDKYKKIEGNDSLASNGYISKVVGSQNHSSSEFNDRCQVPNKTKAKSTNTNKLTLISLFDDSLEKDSETNVNVKEINKLKPVSSKKGRIKSDSISNKHLSNVVITGSNSTSKTTNLIACPPDCSIPPIPQVKSNSNKVSSSKLLNFKAASNGSNVGKNESLKLPEISKDKNKEKLSNNLRSDEISIDNTCSKSTAAIDERIKEDKFLESVNRNKTTKNASTMETFACSTNKNVQIGSTLNSHQPQNKGIKNICNQEQEELSSTSSNNFLTPTCSTKSTNEISEQQRKNDLLVETSELNPSASLLTAIDVDGISKHMGTEACNDIINEEPEKLNSPKECVQGGQQDTSDGDTSIIQIPAKDLQEVEYSKELITTGKNADAKTDVIAKKKNIKSNEKKLRLSLTHGFKEKKPISNTLDVLTKKKKLLDIKKDQSCRKTHVKNSCIIDQASSDTINSANKISSTQKEKSHINAPVSVKKKSATVANQSELLEASCKIIQKTSVHKHNETHQKDIKNMNATHSCKKTLKNMTNKFKKADTSSTYDLSKMKSLQAKQHNKLKGSTNNLSEDISSMKLVSKSFGKEMHRNKSTEKASNNKSTLGTNTFSLDYDLIIYDKTRVLKVTLERLTPEILKQYGISFKSSNQYHSKSSLSKEKERSKRSRKTETNLLLNTTPEISRISTSVDVENLNTSFKKDKKLNKSSTDTILPLELATNLLTEHNVTNASKETEANSGSCFNLDSLLNEMSTPYTSSIISADKESNESCESHLELDAFEDLESEIPSLPSVVSIKTSECNAERIDSFLEWMFERNDVNDCASPTSDEEVPEDTPMMNFFQSYTAPQDFVQIGYCGFITPDVPEVLQSLTDKSRAALKRQWSAVSNTSNDCPTTIRERLGPKEDTDGDDLWSEPPPAKRFRGESDEDTLLIETNSNDTYFPSFGGIFLPRSDDNCSPRSKDNCSPRSDDNYSPRTEDNYSHSSDENCSPNIDYNCSPNIESNCSPNIESNCSPNIESNCSPNIENNCSPNIGDNCSPNIGDNCSPNIDDHCSPDIDDNCSPTIESDLFPDIETNLFPDIESNWFPNNENNYSQMIS